MKSKRIFGRSSLLVFIFTISVILLYKLAGTPFIIKATEPITYYRNNDYPVCLPATYLPHHSPTKHANAAFVILIAHQTDQSRLLETVHSVQDKFNRNFKYPYVFLSNQVLDDTVKSNILSIVPNATFGFIPPEQWSYPTWIDREKLIQSYKSVNNSTDLESDQQRMARYYAGFFFDHPLLQEYDWYWRIEPGSKLLCDITYDPFLYMEKTNKQYGFVLTTSPQNRRHSSTLPAYVRGYTASRRIQPKYRTLFPYFTNTAACQFVSSFEIGSLNVWRNAAYRDFFRYLDHTGNFFYEFWSDGLVHSLAAGLFLDKDQIHYFEDIGYQCSTYHHCPLPSTMNCRCICPVTTTDHAKNTCSSNWKKVL